MDIKSWYSVICYLKKPTLTWRRDWRHVDYLSMNEQRSSTKPNVVFILTDDQGYGDLGCHQHPHIKTPHIDNFHSRSVRLTDFHVGPTCAPTRSTLLTGHYANSTGVWHTIGGRSLLRKDEVSLASIFKANGYGTGIFGKWHLGDCYPYRPQDRGFDKTVIHGGGGIGNTPDHWGNDYFDDTYLEDGVPKQFEGYCTDVWFDQALEYIEDHKETPFFCYLATNAPHSPYNVDKQYSDAYRHVEPEGARNFYGMIANIDENFKRLETRLEELGLRENTILIFMTDNGSSLLHLPGFLDEDGFVTNGNYNAGHRGAKGWAYEGGHKVPFLISWPAGGLEGGKDIDALTASIDFTPTLMELCGLDYVPPRPFHGISLAPHLWEGTPLPPRDVVTDSQRVTRPIKWKTSCVMRDKFRLIDGTELYDLTTDLEQRNDISGNHPELVREMRESYEDWWEKVSHQFELDIPIGIGAERAKSVTLTSHDWRNADCSCAWNQGQVRQGLEAAGYFEIEVEKAGAYQIELRRWPKSEDRPITAGMEEEFESWRADVIAKNDYFHYCGGKALDLKQASLEILEVIDQPACEERSIYYQEASIEEGDSRVLFALELPAGLLHLRGLFHRDQERGDDDSCGAIGAYYIEITRQ